MGGLPAVAGSACGIFHLQRSMLLGRPLMQCRASGSCARFICVLALPGGIPSRNAFVSLSGYGKGPGWVIRGDQAEVWRCLPFAIPLPPFCARSPQDLSRALSDWGVVSGGESSSPSSRLQLSHSRPRVYKEDGLISSNR